MNFIGQNMMMPPAAQGVGGPPAEVGGPPIAPGGPAAELFGPPGQGPMGMPAVSIQLPPGLESGLAFFNPGSVIHGEVAGQDSGTYLLQLGEHTLRADSTVALQVGEPVQFQVQGQNQGKLLLQLLRSPFTRMTTEDLSQTLTGLKVPANETNVTLARIMVEHNIPLTRENFTFLQQVLAQPATPGANGQAPSMPARVAATHFLQSSGVPATPENVSVMANFLASNPQLGVQMFALNTEFRKLSTGRGSNDATNTAELMIGAQGALGEFILEPRRRTAGNTRKKSSARLRDMARQTGIETHVGVSGGSDDEWDLVALLRELRGRCEKEDNKDYGRLVALLKGVEQNLEAHKLINSARHQSDLGYYYLQVPMRLENGDAAEIWVRYHTEEDGSRVVDPEETRIEFLVTTEFMGELYFTVELRGGTAHVDLGTPSEQVREFAARYLPALADRIAGLGWRPGRVGATYRPFSGRRQLVERTEFDQLERCNVQA